MIVAGEPFPDFELQDQDGNWVKNSDWLGTKTVVYVYPKDDTPGCTVEACEFRDALSEFGGVRIVGLSADTPASHQKFIAKYNLNFPLLSDPERKLLTALGAYGEKVLYGKISIGIIRSTFIVDESGIVVKVWQKVKAGGHAATVWKSLQ